MVKCYVIFNENIAFKYTLIITLNKHRSKYNKTRCNNSRTNSSNNGLETMDYFHYCSENRNTIGIYCVVNRMAAIGFILVLY